MSRHLQLETSEPEDVLEAIRRAYQPMRLRFESRRPHFRFRLHQPASRGRLLPSAHAFRTDGALEIRTDPLQGHFNLSLMLDGEAEFEHRGVRSTARAGELIFASPWDDAIWRTRGSYAEIDLKIEAKALLRIYRQLTGEELHGELVFQGVIPSGQTGCQSVVGLLDTLCRDLGRPGGLMESPLTAASFEELVLRSILVQLPHSGSRRLKAPSPSAGLSQVRRAEDYLRAHLHAPLTVGDLADATGVSTRSLQAAFRKHRGRTPREVIREARLELASARLRASRPGATVTEVALDCGFRHLGRFSRQYRERFGRLPSEDLTRRG